MTRATRTSRQRRADIAFKCLTGACAMVIVLVMAGILTELVLQSRPSIQRFGAAFLVSRAWNPVTQDFGAASSIFGTLVSTAIAMLLAIPLGLATALLLVELTPPLIGRIVGGAIELLAAIPSIIYGMWGLFVLAPFMARHVQPALGRALGFLPLFQGPPMGIGMLTAGLILALMVLPFICAVSRDVFHMVPPVLKESAHGMGATVWEVTWKVTIPHCKLGIIGAAFLGLGRAVGETMAVTFVIGNNHTISPSLFSAGNSIASTLANEFTEASEPMYYSALVELALVLFAVTFLFQLIAQLWLWTLRRRMGGEP